MNDFSTSTKQTSAGGEPATRNVGQLFCLFPLNSPVDGHGGAQEVGRAAKPPPIVLVDRRTPLAIGDGGQPALSAHTLEPKTSDVVLESARHESRSMLLLVRGARQDVRVNGAAALPYEVLVPGDVLEVDGCSLHVGLLVQPYIGPPQARHVGTACSLCRASISPTENAQVYECPGCQRAMHMQFPLSGGELLECARSVAACPVCQTPVSMKQEYVDGPDD